MFDHSVTISNELVSLEPMYLDQKILEHLQRKLKESKVGKCTKEQGSIKDIKIKKIEAAEISMADGGTRFSVTYTVQSLLPTFGKVYTTKKVVVINHNNVCCVISTIDETCEDKPFQIFIINGAPKGKKYEFSDCECSIPIVAHPVDFVLPNIVVDTVEYHEKQFIVTGKHIHDYKHKPSIKPSKHDKEVRSKTEKK
jgi:hypothetical protein